MESREQELLANGTASGGEERTKEARISQTLRARARVAVPKSGLGSRCFAAVEEGRAVAIGSVIGLRERFERWLGQSSCTSANCTNTGGVIL